MAILKHVLIFILLQYCLVTCHLVVYIYLKNILLLILFLISWPLLSHSPLLSVFPSPDPILHPSGFPASCVRWKRGKEEGIFHQLHERHGGQTAERGIAFQCTISSFVFPETFTCCSTEEYRVKSLPFKRKTGQTAIRHKGIFQRGQFSFDIRSFPPFRQLRKMVS